MALPATRIVTGKYTDPVTGEPLKGSVIFSPFPAVWTDTAGNQIMMTSEVIELDDNTGEFSQSVVRTDAPDVLPVQGKLWRFTENIRGATARPPTYFEVNAGSGSVDITDLIKEDPPPEVAPSNAAGGDLTGTYPNPSLADTDLARTHLHAVHNRGDTMTGALRLEYGRISSDVGHDLTVVSNTGVMSQTGPMVLAGPTSVTIPQGLATFVDPSHNHDDPKVEVVEFGGVTIELDDPTDPLTYFLVGPTGAVIQNDGVPTRQQRRQFAVLGRVVVLGGQIVNVQDSPILSTHPMHMVLDILQALGDIRVNGVLAQPVAGTLTFSVGAGDIFNLGANNSLDPNDPNVSPFAAQNPAQFRYVTQNDVIDMVPRTAIDPTIYDVGGVVTPVPGGANTTTVQRVHCFPTQNIFIQLAQNTFSSLAAALDALAVGESGAMPFVTHPDLRGGGVRTAFIVTTKTAVDLADDAAARVIRATQFGNPGGL